MEKNYTLRSLTICTAHQILLGDQIKKNEIGGTCNTYGGEERCIQGFGGGNLRERDHLKDPGVDGMVILR